MASETRIKTASEYLTKMKVSSITTTEGPVFQFSFSCAQQIREGHMRRQASQSNAASAKVREHQIPTYIFKQQLSSTWITVLTYRKRMVALPSVQYLLHSQLRLTAKLNSLSFKNFSRKVSSGLSSTKQLQTKLLALHSHSVQNANLSTHRCLDWPWKLFGSKNET